MGPRAGHQNAGLIRTNRKEIRVWWLDGLCWPVGQDTWPDFVVTVTKRQCPDVRAPGCSVVRLIVRKTGQMKST
jgi:hypothetical protein